MLRRTFLRGLVRQMGSPAVLAATYSNNTEQMASAAVNELQEALVRHPGYLGLWVSTTKPYVLCSDSSLAHNKAIVKMLRSIPTTRKMGHIGLCVQSLTLVRFWRGRQPSDV
jgi:hypothetical protein